MLCTASQILLGDQIKEMGGACSTMGKRTVHTGFGGGNSKRETKSKI